MNSSSDCQMALRKSLQMIRKIPKWSFLFAVTEGIVEETGLKITLGNPSEMSQFKAKDFRDH